MDVVAVQSSVPFSSNPSLLESPLTRASGKQQADILVLEAATETLAGTDVKDTDLSGIYKALTVTAKEIIEKLNGLLKADLPGGIESLKPEEVTPEATAERIVQGTTSYFEIFAKQNPNLSGEALLEKFMETIRGGIASGYASAVGTLEELGAFQFEGVRSGVEETKALIEKKLAAFEAFKRKELGLDDAQEEAAAKTSAAVAALGGGLVARAGGLNVTA